MFKHKSDQIKINNIKIMKNLKRNSQNSMILKNYLINKSFKKIKILKNKKNFIIFHLLMVIMQRNIGKNQEIN